MESGTQSANNIDRVAAFARIRLVVLVLLGLAVVTPVALLAMGLYGAFDTPFRERGVTDPASDFSSITYLPWPQSARLVAAGDSHWDGKSGGFGFGPGILDGTLHIVFDADPAVLRTWLSQSPPWGESWQHGPVPDHIAINFPDAVTLPRDVRYAAASRNSRVPFWDGELIALDVKSGRVWLVRWDK
jgi:hypothetical protein